MDDETTGRSPYGERGLKYHRHRIPDTADRRSPYGERGLKYWVLYRMKSNHVALLTESVD